MLVHFQDDSILPNYSFIEAAIDESLLENVEKLPKTWRESPPPFEVQKIGDNWIKRNQSAVLRVPSVIIPSESNYLLNSNHTDFSKIMCGAPQSFTFDKRLLKNTK